MNEVFIGGFTSGFLARGFLGTRVGYGLYFTTERLFGVDPANFSGGSLGGSTAGLIEGELMPTLNPGPGRSLSSVSSSARRISSSLEIRSRRSSSSSPVGWGWGG